MIDALALYRTSIGKKAVMAVTGIILFAYVFVHMLGNLKIFTGAEHLNAYAIWLREVASPFFGHEQVLWLIRLVLLVSVVLHIVAAYQVTRQDLASRPVRYAQRKDVASTYAARTIRWGGVILGLFIIYHLLHFTCDAGTLDEVSRVFRIDDGVMRHMATRRIEGSPVRPVAVGAPAREDAVVASDVEEEEE